MKKAREAKEFKKVMTERSGYSATKGQKAALKQLKPRLNQLKGDYKSSLPNLERETLNNSRAGFGGKDGAQI